MCFNLFNIPETLATLFVTILMCYFQVRCSCNIIPRYLNSSTESIDMSSIDKFSGVTFFWLLRNVMYLVFCTCKDSLFSFRQFITLFSSLLISKLALCGMKCSLLKYSVVSYAYKKVLQFITRVDYIINV